MQPQQKKLHSITFPLNNPLRSAHFIFLILKYFPTQKIQASYLDHLHLPIIQILSNFHSLWSSIHAKSAGYDTEMYFSVTGLCFAHLWDLNCPGAILKAYCTFQQRPGHLSTSVNRMKDNVVNNYSNQKPLYWNTDLINYRKTQ